MKILLIASLFLFANVATNAQQKSLDPNSNLDSLSDEYLKVGDVHCLVIDAVKDRLIKPDKCYDIQFSHNILTVNGEVASKKMSARYLDKIRQLNKYRGLPDNDYYNFASINGSPGVSIDKPEPYISAEVRKKQEEQRTYACKRLVNTLLSDQLIYSTDEVSIRYTDDGIWINNRKLSVKQERKYTLLVQPVARNGASDGFTNPHHNNSIWLTGYKW